MKGQRWVLTGFKGMLGAEDRLTKLGASVDGNVCCDTDCLVVGPKPNKYKVERANEFGVPMITPSTMWKAIERQEKETFKYTGFADALHDFDFSTTDLADAWKHGRSLLFPCNIRREAVKKMEREMLDSIRDNAENEFITMHGYDIPRCATVKITDPLTGKTETRSMLSGKNLHTVVMDEATSGIEQALSDESHPYHELADVLEQAFQQAANGKGKERHANDLPFVNQKMQTIAQGQGHSGGLIYQVCKKAQESERMDHDAALRELLGVIVYAAGAFIFRKENDE